MLHRLSVRLLNISITDVRDSLSPDDSSLRLLFPHNCWGNCLEIFHVLLRMNCHHVVASKLNVSFVLCFDVRPEFPVASAELCVKHQMLLQQPNKLLSPAKLSSLCSELATKSKALSSYFCFNIRIWTNSGQKWTTLIMATVQPWSSRGSECPM